MNERKGLILAGGSGTRLHPITLGISKQLLPVYDKPMIYYPLSVLMLAGIRQICIITAPDSTDQFKWLLGNGSQWGISLDYVEQPTPDGLAQAYILADDFLGGAPSALVLGDNIFYGSGLSALLKKANEKESGGTVFGYKVQNPREYGVVSFDKDGRANEIVEKPAEPKSNYAVTGLYFLDANASVRARQVTPSHRGELEITSLLESYLHQGGLSVEIMSRGYAWLDTGSYKGLLDAGNFVRTLQDRQGLQIGCPEEVAFNNRWIKNSQLLELGETQSKSDYGRYLINLAKEAVK